MTFFVNEIITPPSHLPITVDEAQAALARAVVEEIEHGVLWRAIVRQERRIVIDGVLPPRLELEPVTAIVGITRWTPTDSAAVIDAATYYSATRDPGGTILVPVPGKNWPAPMRPIGSFALTYMAGWKVTPASAPGKNRAAPDRSIGNVALTYMAGGKVTPRGAGDAVNEVPASVRLMVERAIAFRAGSGLAGLSIGSLKINVADSYATDKLPREITNIARAYAYRPGLFAGRP